MCFVYTLYCNILVVRLKVNCNVSIHLFFIFSFLAPAGERHADIVFLLLLMIADVNAYEIDGMYVNEVTIRFFCCFYGDTNTSVCVCCVCVCVFVLGPHNAQPRFAGALNVSAYHQMRGQMGKYKKARHLHMLPVEYMQQFVELIVR